MASPRKFSIDVTVPEGLKAGDVFTMEVEVPAPAKIQRGVLAGIALADMTDEQLKREIINAGSVLYKAKQREAAAETIAAGEARLAAAKAEKAKRVPVAIAAAAATPNVEGAVVEPTESAPVETDPDTQAEI